MLEYRYICESDKELIEQFQCDDEPTVRSFLVENALRLQQLKLASTRLYFDEQGD